MQYREPENKELVIAGLKTAGRTDLIGNGRQFLVSANERMTNQYALKQRRIKK